jgi:hypothetical protein
LGTFGLLAMDVRVLLVMDHAPGRAPDVANESDIRMEAAIAALVMSSARLKDVIFSGPEEAVESAFAALRLARVRFLAVRADYRDAYESDL